MRLVGGNSSNEGRVEVYYNRRWQTVCDDYWDIADAHVVCRQLGYRGAVTAHKIAHFGPGAGSILLDNLHCNGTESSLLRCTHRGINEHNCVHNEDAGVTCKSTLSIIVLSLLLTTISLLGFSGCKVIKT